jgi:putative Mn2+ efflux pump MntP
MDAFAFSIVTGSVYRDSTSSMPYAWPCSRCLSGGDAGDRVSGGLGLKDYISHVDHWVAFGLLAFVAAR